MPASMMMPEGRQGCLARPPASTATPCSSTHWLTSSFAACAIVLAAELEAKESESADRLHQLLQQQQAAAAKQLAKVQRKSEQQRMRAKAAEARVAQVEAELARRSGAMGEQGAAAAQGSSGSKKRKTHAARQGEPPASPV